MCIVRGSMLVTVGSDGQVVMSEVRYYVDEGPGGGVS